MFVFGIIFVWWFRMYIQKFIKPHCFQLIDPKTQLCLWHFVFINIAKNFIFFYPFPDTLSASVSPSHTIVTVGTSLSLRCEVSGSPILYLKWKKNLKPLVLDNRIRQQSNNVLEIANVRLGDEGLYQCFIYNSEESAQGSSTVIIQGESKYNI